MDSFAETKSNETDGKYRIYQSPEFLLIKHMDYNKYLQFDLLNSNACTEVTKEALGEIVLTESKVCPLAIIGVMKIDKWSLLVYVNAHEVIGKINNKEIYTIKEIDFIPITNEQFTFTTEIKYYLDGLKTLMHTGFYYSFEYDLTMSLQASKNPKQDSKQFLESQYYNYNYNLKKVLLDLGVNTIFTNCNLINGYVGIQSADLNGENVDLILISRRSRFMAGTLFNCKGIDLNGDTANFVETEQIMKIGNKYFSFVIYRGSQPLLLKADKSNYENTTKINEELSCEVLSKSVVAKHIEKLSLKEKFNVFLINLLSDNIEKESILNKHIQNSLFPTQTSTGGICRLTRFDFKNTLITYEGNDFTMLENFANRFISSQNSDILYYCEDTKFKSSIPQKGIIRVNCLNSLDRTNIMQAALCWKVCET